MADLKLYLNKWWSNAFNRSLSIALVLLGILILSLGGKVQSPEKPEKEIVAADTIIPSGFVLVPIELANHESVLGLIADFAIVDLFTARNSLQKGGEKIGARLKLIRAPLNPNQFAVLVPEDKSQRILEDGGPFYAVVKNPKQSLPEELLAKQRHTKAKVEYNE